MEIAPQPTAANTAELAADEPQPAGGNPGPELTNPMEIAPQPTAANTAELAAAEPLPADILQPDLGAPEGVFPGEGDDRLVMHFRNQDIREVLECLSEQGNLNILAGHNVQGTVSASLKDVDIDSALDAILKSTGYVAKREGKFIYVGTPTDFETMEQSLDTIGTRVYRPNYVTAAELQTLIEPLSTPDIGVVSVSSPAQSGIQTDNTAAGGDDFAGGEVVLVRDYEAILCEIDQVVAEIDVRPMQVAIEAMILSVRLDDKYQFGVDWELLRNKEHVRFGFGEPLDSLAEFQFNGPLKFAFLDSSLGIFIEALESIGDTNVIATPRLMVLNKQKAEILIGEQLGYVSTTITETSSAQNVEFLDVGAQLRLRPFISSDGLIRMEVHPELSTGSVDTESGFTLPNKETTQVTTNIMVRDGCTVVIGGLMREELETDATQVPLLGNLPWIGVAFRKKHERMQRREIIVLITPHIVYEPDTCADGDHVACEFHRRQATYAEKMSPLGKRSIGRRYFRLAQNAWAVGDRKQALRFAEMAVQFDPLNRAAIDLRASIWQSEPLGDHTLEGRAAIPVPTGPLDGDQIEGWVLEDLEGGRPAAQPIHPLDPGTPGRRRDLMRPRRLR
jgi:type IV pilus assembly protein PilQ